MNFCDNAERDQANRRAEDVQSSIRLMFGNRHADWAETQSVLPGQFLVKDIMLLGAANWTAGEDLRASMEK